MLFEGSYNIGDEADIEDGEIRAIQDGLHRLSDLTKEIHFRSIYLWVDNQNVPKALAGGPTSSREHLRKWLEEAEILHQAGCEIEE